MTIDLYALCPCGNGKKIKFCKCKESVGELDRVMKMVEGGQMVPALDRLSSILQEHPDAAWALAIRGRLLLDLREFKSLAENADRFIRLQPSNPLALTQRAAAKLFSGDVKSAVDAVLEALTESGRQVDSFVLDVASVLALALAQHGDFLTGRVYATMALSASGYEGGQTAMQVLRSLNSSPSVNMLLKVVPEPIERPEDVEWGERYDEAIGLLSNNKVTLAQTKLESLQRVAPDEPAVLLGLLNCAIWDGDPETQSEVFRKLAACESLDFESRCRYRALASLVQPGAPELSVEVMQLAADVEDAEQVELAMTAAARFVPLPAEMLAEFKVNDDDVAPRAGFQIVDRDPPELDQLPTLDEMPAVLAMGFVYGKQTDRSARVEVLDIRRPDEPQVRQQLQQIIGDAELAEQPADPLPLQVAGQPAMAIMRFRAAPADAERLQAELFDARMPATLASLPLPLLGGQSLIETANDDSKRLERTAAMRVIENYDSLSTRDDEVMAKLYELAGLEPLPPLQPTADQVEEIANEDLNRVDPSQLDNQSLAYLLNRADHVSATLAVRKIAAALLEREFSDDEKSIKMVAYMAMVQRAASSDTALDWLAQAKLYAASIGISAAGLLLTEIRLRLVRGDAEGFQAALGTLTNEYGNQPEVMAQLQQLLMSLGLIRPDGSPRGAPSAAANVGGPSVASPAATGGGIWTPDGASAPPPSPAAGESGGGKLWVPGMD